MRVSLMLILPCIASAALADAKFAEQPTAKAVGDKVQITFALDSPAGVEVAILAADGSVVRHLAAGVLGKNAPPPLTPDSLKQTLVWDRTDDAGKPVAGADGGPAGFKVRVGIGLGEKVEKTYGFDPHTFRDIVGLAVNAKGELYVLDTQSTYGASSIRVYDREGKYLRTIMPRPAGLPDERVEPIGQLTTKTGQKVPIVYNAHGQNTTPYTSGMKGQTMVFDKAGNLVVVSSVGTIVEHGPPRFLLFFDEQGGAPKTPGFVGPPLQPARGFMGGSGEGGSRYQDNLAISPDGQFIYYAGGPVAKSRHAIYRIKPTDTELPKPWLGDPATQGDDEQHFNQPMGLAVDAAGRLYVADRGNNRVLVLSTEGKRLGSFPVASPLQVFVHPKNGSIYVSSVVTDERARTKSSSIVKFAAFPEGGTPAKRAELTQVSEARGSQVGIMALDASAEPAKLWIATNAPIGQDLVPVIDNGDSLAPGKGLGRIGGLRQPMFVSADRKSGKMYVTELSNSQRQFDLKTGEMKIFVKGGEAVVGPDGFVYIVTGYEPVNVMRYDAASSPANFPGSTENKMGPINTASKGPNVGFRGHAFGPGGDIYMLEMSFYGDGKVNVYTPEGKLKKENLITHIPNGSTGIAVDRQGNVIIGVNIKPESQIYPDDFMDCLPKTGWVWWRKPQPAPWNRTYYNGYLYHWGEIFKFSPAGGGFYRDFKEVTTNGDGPMQIPPDAKLFKVGYLNGNVGVKGALWYYHGYGPVATTNLNWGDPSCVCMGARMAVDDYGRIYSPDPFRFAINVLDANGNLVGRLGRYGNADDPGLSLAWGAYCSYSGDRLFIGDTSNRRVTMVDATPASCATVEVK